MTNRFEFTDEDGDRLTCRPMLGIPAILLKTSPNGVVIPLARLEELVNGERDMARQAGGQTPEPHDEALCGHCDVPRASHHHPWTSTSDVIANDPQSAAEQLAAAFTVAERQFLTFALDLASDHMADRGDEFSDEDEAALDRFRAMAVGEAGA